MTAKTDGKSPQAPRRLPVRLALIATGTLGAWGAGSLAVWWKNRGISAADQAAMSGMFAFGDSVAFLAVAAMVAVVPTLLLLRLAGPSPRFWRAHARGSLVLACTGLAAGVLFLLPVGGGPGPLDTVRSLSVLRVLAAPLFLLVFSPGLLPAAGPNRRTTLAACAIELGAMGCFVLGVAITRR